MLTIIQSSTKKFGLNTIKINKNFLTTATNIAVKSYDEMPGPKPLPIAGNLFEIKNFGGEFDLLNYREFTVELQKKYGDIVKWNLFGKRECFVYDPVEFKNIFKNDGLMPLRPVMEPMVKVLEIMGISNTLATSQGDRWRKLRTAVNPVMARPQTIYSYLPDHNQVADEFIELLNKRLNNQDKSAILDNFEDDLRLLALEYISEVVFDKRIKCMEKNNSEALEFVTSVNDFTVYCGRLMFSSPIWKIYPTKDWKMFLKASKHVYSEVRKYIKEAHDDLLEKKSKNQEVRMTALNQLLTSQEKYNLKLDDSIAIMADLLLGGVDTTSTTLHYFLYEIGKNMDVQERLYEELSSILKPNEQITEEHLTKLKYLKYTVKENFRLNSIVPSNARFLREDLVIGNYLVPKGTQINFGTAYITRSERFFKDPLKFDPTRWQRDEIGEDLIDPYSNLTFGFGVRMCIGRRTAEQEIYLTIAKLVQNFKIEYIGPDPKVKIGLIATPDIPLKIKLSKRN